MLEKTQIEKLALDALKTDEDLFLVDIKVSPNNKIDVVVDGMNGVNINTCAEISRHIESLLDRDEEDFELQVSSAGLGKPFKVKRQYLKNIGRDIEVVLKDGVKFKGELTSVTDNGISISFEEKVKLEGEKKKKLVQRDEFVDFENIKKANTIIKFK